MIFTDSTFTNHRRRDMATRRQWVKQITAVWKKAAGNTVRSFVLTGAKLLEARKDLKHGDWKLMIEKELPFSKRTAQYFVGIASDVYISKVQHAALLPPDWTTLGALVSLHKKFPDKFDGIVADGTLHSGIERGEVGKIIRLENILTQQKRAPPSRGGNVVDLIAFGDKDKFGAIYADPPWSFEVYSGKGKARSAETHYPTMKLADIAALPIARLAAKNCALFMWAVWPELPGALEVIKSWGFEYKTAAFVWIKTTKNAERVELNGKGLFTGMGYWTRANSEV